MFTKRFLLISRIRNTLRQQNHLAESASCFIIIRNLQIVENNENLWVSILVKNIFSRVFGNTGETLAHVYKTLIYLPILTDQK